MRGKPRRAQPIVARLSMTSSVKLVWRRLLAWYRTHFTVRRTGVCVYRYDPVFAVCENRQIEGWFIFVMIYVAVFFIPKFLLAFSNGMLTSPTLSEDFSADLRRFPLFRMTLKIPADRLPLSTPAIPYLRDYVDIAVGVLMALHMALLHSKWRNLSLFLPQLWSDGILNRRVIREDSYERITRRYDKRANSAPCYLLPLAFAVAGAAAFFWLFQTSGIYSSLSPGLPGWERLAWQRWWANPMNGKGAFLFEASWISFILYYMFRHNVIGCVALLTIRDLVTGSRRRSVLALDPDHADGHGGIGRLRDIVFQVFGSVAIMGFSLLLAYFMVPSGAAQVLAPFLGIFLCLNPLYIVVPVVVTNREIKAFRDEALRAGHRQLDAAKAGMDRERILVLRSDIERIERLPKALISPGEILTFLILYLIPLVLFWDWVLGKFWGK